MAVRGTKKGMKKHNNVSVVEALSDIFVGALRILRNAVVCGISLLFAGAMLALAAVEEGNYITPFWAKLIMFFYYVGIVEMVIIAVVVVLAVIYFFAIFMAKRCRITAMKMYPKYRRSLRKKEKLYRGIARFIVCLKEIALSLIMLLDF